MINGTSRPGLACVMVALAGCGAGRPAVVPTTGQVFINGQPLTGRHGFVRVEPAGARPAIGQIDERDGTFTLTTFVAGDGCAPGTHPVAVIVNTTVGANLVSLIPEHYGDAATSGLEVTIGTAPAALRLELAGELKTAPRPTAAELQADTPSF
jgi:hypothetical protein